MPEIPVGQARQGLAGGRHEDAPDVPSREDIFPFEDHRGGAARERLLDEAAAVLLETGNRHEDLARLDLSRVVGDAPDLGRHPAEHRLVGQSVEQARGGHGWPAHWLTAGCAAGPASVRRHGMPADIGVPGAGTWATTTPWPRTSRVTSKPDSAAIAPRRERPWRDGITSDPGDVPSRLASLSGGTAAAMSPALELARRIGTGEVPCGGTFRCLSASRPMAEKIGAAASLPHFSFLGSSSITIMAMRGSSAGANPTKDKTPGACE